MTTTPWSRFLPRRHLLGAVLAASVASASAQQAPASATAPDLARYDINKNGVLDSAELAAREADRNKVAPVVVTATKAANEETVVLSPFVITAEQDKGYQATSTLAGTRLRTDLRDLAASISVVTKDLMEDLGVNSLDQLATYTLGTEIGGIDGNFSATGVDQNFVSFDGPLSVSTTPRVRVRGITGDASRTRHYFLTDIGGDAYNIDRIDIQRGPNGMLFGLGSPQGVINDGMIKANPQRNSTKVSSRFGSYDGQRGSIDHNQVLLKDKLARVTSQREVQRRSRRRASR